MFDLVAEIYTVQALYGQARAAAIAALPGLVAPGGTLLVIARATDDQDPVRDPAARPPQPFEACGPPAPIDEACGPRTPQRTGASGAACGIKRGKPRNQGRTT
ncbi:MAG TPA: hypothetical protein VIY52_16600, partial [Streptosporangiaceae bacterium]